MAIFGTFDGVRDQFPRTERMMKAAEIAAEYFREGSDARERAFGRSTGESVKIDFADGLFGIEEAYFSKASEAVRWEAHTDWTDVQLILDGEEIIEVTDLWGLTLQEDGRPERDIQFFEPRAAGSRLHLTPGCVAILRPVDAHRPSLAVGEPALVRKVVLKVRG
jgi:YhcH/YjgK/YiaL family protein